MKNVAVKHANTVCCTTVKEIQRQKDPTGHITMLHVPIYKVEIDFFQFDLGILFLLFFVVWT